jgi:murein DD-endopeptidase MepM/ murein hydrolase activator NlpD
MRSCDAVFRAHPWPRLVALSLLGLGLVGCSADTQRFDSNPFAANNAPPAGDVTGSVPHHPTAKIETRPLPQTTAQLPPPTRPPVSGTGVAGGAKGMASYQPGNRDITGSVRGPAARRATAKWDWNGGTAIIVVRGDTVNTLAHRYGVPASAIMQANNISNPNGLHPGQRIVIPRYHAVASASAPRPAPSGGIRAAARTRGNVHVVAPGETLMMLSRRYHVSLVTLARVNNIPPSTLLKIGDRIVIPGAQRAAPVAAVPHTVPPARQHVVAAESPHVARTVTPSSEQPKPHKAAIKTAEPAGTLPSFRWPVRGRIISAYGPKPNGQKNDGINLAVPEGTPIKAAEGGLVVYVGNELKGYGNLVLLRHGNGFVTAYAHNSKILVKRGETVKRGQVIARAGQTGNVSSPQLHFEIRKGSLPVDPTKFLNGA